MGTKCARTVRRICSLSRLVQMILTSVAKSAHQATTQTPASHHVHPVRSIISSLWLGNACATSASLVRKLPAPELLARMTADLWAAMTTCVSMVACVFPSSTGLSATVLLASLDSTVK